MTPQYCNVRTVGVRMQVPGFIRRYEKNGMRVLLSKLIEKYNQPDGAEAKNHSNLDLTISNRP